MGYIDKLHITFVIYAEVEALRLVVDTRRYSRLRGVELQTVVYIDKAFATFNKDIRPSIMAVNFYFLIHSIFLRMLKFETIVKYELRLYYKSFYLFIFANVFVSLAFYDAKIQFIAEKY